MGRAAPAGLRICAVFCALPFAVASCMAFGEGTEDPMAATLEFEDGGVGDGGARSDPHEFFVGEPIILRLVIQNNSDKPWSVDRRLFGTPRAFIVRDSDGKPVYSNLKVDWRWYPVLEAHIKPGERQLHRVGLSSLYPYIHSASPRLVTLYKAGDFSVQAFLRSPVETGYLPRGKAWPESLYPRDLQTNTLYFRVVAPHPEQIEVWLKDIGSAHQNERIRRIQLLGAAEANEAVAALCALAIQDESYHVRVVAIQALGKIQDPASVECIEKAVQRDPSTTVRAYAADVLGQWGLKRSVPILIDSLRYRTAPSRGEAEDWVWYAAVVKALGDIGDPRAISVLKEIAEQDPTGWLREAAAASIERIKAGGAKRPGKTEATTGTPSMRWPAEWVIGGLVAVLLACALLWRWRKLRRKPHDGVRS